MAAQLMEQRHERKCGKGNALEDHEWLDGVNRRERSEGDWRRDQEKDPAEPLDRPCSKPKGDRQNEPPQGRAEQDAQQEGDESGAKAHEEDRTTSSMVRASR